MKILLALLFFLVSLGCCISQDMERVKKTLNTLCSPDFHGRGYVNSGDKKAAEYISSEFSKVGLQSFGSDYYQPFSFSINTFPGEVSVKIDKKELIAGEDFIPDAESAGGTGTINLCFLDTLIFTDSTALTNFLSVKGENFFLVFKAEDLRKQGKIKDRILEKFQTFKGIIELQKSKLTASVATRQEKRVYLKMLEKSLPPNAKKIKYKIKTVYLPDYTSQNIVGFLSGSTRKDSLIVIAAHYDHLGRLGNNAYFPGANDNASGVSLLLELADYYQKKPSPYTIVFIAFGAEEAGLIGSHHFVNNPLFSLEKIKFLLNLDLVGTGDEGIAVVNGALLLREFKILSDINDTGKYFSLVKKRGEAANSDHFFFYKKGVKSFFIYTLGGVSAYHDVYDIPETLPLTKYRELFKLITQFVESI